MRHQVLFLALATLGSTMHVPTRSLFERQATCPANYEQCGNSLPSSFCCPNGKVCLQLAGKTSTLCCDSADGCDFIQPIVCDIQLQQDPRSSVKTTALNSDLPKCGKDCCPFGYTCNEDLECARDSDQSKAPPARALSTSAGSAPTSTSPSTSASASSSASGTAKPVTDEAPSGADDSAAKASIIGGVIGSVILLIIVGLGLCWCLRRKKKNDEALLISGRPTSNGTYPHVISHPIVSENSTMRTDFSRKDNNSSIHRESRHFDTIDLHDERRPVSKDSPRNPFNDRPISAETMRSTVAPLRGMRASSGSSIGSRRLPREGGYGGMGGGAPRTPDRQRQPSTESINVFADPRTVSERDGVAHNTDQRRMSSQTTFTHMMRQAELAPDQPFVPLAAYSTPDRRK